MVTSAQGQRHIKCSWVSRVHRDKAGRLCKIHVFSGGKRLLSSIFTCATLSWPHSLPSPHPCHPVSQPSCHISKPTLQSLCPRLTPSNLRSYHQIFLTFSDSALLSTCLDFLSSQPFSASVLLFPHLSSAFFSQQFPYWAQLVFILSSVCPNPQSCT